ncbi:uncharacterized protein B0I36DRAFT_76936 [Microdochium trichocladiopsis]|uniref:PHD-type domain-containing protein n=1 Tax=Microdochium trichocladiopsis TaxID=1682393 RepID=A0A9P8YG05_9PEZI|nr:uncharacterized protein B0I36DRAFT_76936 [Microdochium trichocladiopsis]KAH7038207.1 hypothetical protein B0I36DRAFT_76936 [Microdochium trichocladiopsis]
MSGEGNNSSFGTARPQPPTPRQTPTSAVFPTSVFETPKDDRNQLDDTTTWTPKFAEEYSVFNTTPGNLRGGHGQFSDFAAPSPYLGSAPKRRPLSVASVAAEVASHTNHFSHSQDIPLPPVDPSQRLSSSPAGLITNSRIAEPETPTGLAHRAKRRDQRRGSQGVVNIQIATPPPSTHKGGRRLAPKPQDEVMQDEQLYAQDYVAGPVPQQNMGSFTLASPTDMFGFTLAPATAPAFTEARSFWDTDMTGMEMDFSMADASMFQAAAAGGHRPGDSMDWGRSNDLFHAQSMIAPQNQELNKVMQQNGKKERPLAPKPVANDIGHNANDVSGLANSFPMGMDDPFALGGASGVDPGLLFTRPSSSGMIPATYDPMGQMTLLGDTILPGDNSQHMFPTQVQGELRRSASSKEVSSKKGDRIISSSPAKALGRPGLSRSMSENRGRKTLARSATLPTLAPAARSMAPPPQQPPQKSNRPSAPTSRTGGRISPLKHNRRLSSLASIPESASPRTRTSVKFTIDSRGRARAETTTIVVGKGEDSDRTPRAARVRDSSRKNRSPTKSWASGEDDSSSDDEPIIIPSRNSSFMMPEHPRPSSSSNTFQSSRRSISENSASSLGIYFNEQQQQQQQEGGESDAETVLNVPDSGRPVGDAASELRKVVQTRQKHMAVDTSRSFISAPPHAVDAISPTKFGDVSLPTPSSDRGSHVRCVCSSTQSRINGDAYMVQCESCEMYLHGKCINITRQTHPKVYICAFCANTSNVQRQGGRDARSGRSGNTMPRAASSPLAHKSFKSFR